MDLTDFIYIKLVIPKNQNTHYFQMQWNIFKDRSHDRTQNKPPQIQENWNHRKHLLRTQQPKIRKQPQQQQKTPKHSNSWTLNSMLLKWMGKEWDQGRNQKVSGN